MSDPNRDRDLPDWLVHTLANAPRKPGCYLMKNRLGEIVYVGKAQDLRTRLNQYFQPATSDTRFFVGLLDRVLGAIDVIIAANAKEALLLENELIKRHQPRFNVKLKDDKNYLSIRIGTEHPYPRLEVVRRRKRDGAAYFGPYHSASALRQTLKIVNRHFQLRTCTDAEFARRTRPCLEFDMGRCPAPCVFPIDRDEYAKHVEEVRLFLAGKSHDLVARLKAKMQAASDALDFERAARYRDQLAAIDRSLTPQKVILDDAVDLDAIALVREGERALVQVLRVSEGVLAGAQSYPMKRTLLPDEELLDGFLGAYYDGTRPIPDLVLTSLPLTEAATWSELLSEARAKKVEVRSPQRGDKLRLIELALENAQATFQAARKSEADALETLANLQKQLHLNNLPRRIECFDNSNTQGKEPVSSMVVAIDGALAKQEYRMFKIRSQDTPNDYETMREVLTRRLRQIARGSPPPDLILLDGGKGQLAIAEAVLAELAPSSPIELASLAEIHLLDAAGHRAPRARPLRPSSAAPEHIPDRVFRPGQKNPILFRPNANELFLLQRLRDEAHRFAITFHRKLRAKRTLDSALDHIPGVGPARKKALLARFGSVDRIRAASASDLAETPGVSLTLAEAVLAALRPS